MEVPFKSQSVSELRKIVELLLEICTNRVGAETKSENRTFAISKVVA